MPTTDRPLNKPTTQMPHKIRHTIIRQDNVLSHSGNEHTAITNDPSFLIKIDIDPSFLERAECHIRMTTAVVSQFDRTTTELYLDEGNGYSQVNSIMRFYAWGETQEYIIHRRFTGKPIRFDPTDRPGRLSIKYLHFYIWSAKASKAIVFFDFSRRSKDPTSAFKKNRFTHYFPSSTQESFDSIYAHYIAGKPDLLHEPYSLWAKYVETSRRARRHASMIMGTQVKFSLLVPTYNTNPAHLEECIRSVIEQTYRNWELCIVDDCSTNADTIIALLRLCAEDSRIKLKRRDRNGHICNATNDALDMASGDRICFLDHDDCLAPDALQCFADAILKNPKLDLIYSDEDFISLDGCRISPHFKSDWNPDLLLSHNYITHLVCAKTDRVRAIGGLRLGTEGAQDYDFLLRYTNDLDSTKILHIADILYHWRISETSTAGSSSAKPYTVAAGEKALQDIISLQQINATVLCLDNDNFYEVRRKVQSPSSNKISIIIPTKNCYYLLKTCVESILSKTVYPNYEIIIVDNGSDDIHTIRYLRDFSARSDALSRVRILSFNEPFNYSRINNFAFHHAKGNIVCLLNNDTEVIEPQWLDIMAGHVLRPEVGCVGAKLLFDDDTIQHAGIILSLGGYAGHSHKGLANNSFGYFLRPHVTQEVSAVTGACLMVRSEVYRCLNGLDEVLFPIAYNDVDFCLKAKDIGLRNIYAASASLYHYESKSRGYEDTPEKKLRFQKEQTNLLKTWGHMLIDDPFYNPNLTKDREDFSIRVN